MSDLATALRTVTPGDVRDDAYTRHLFSTDASMYSIEPLPVVFPRDASDVAAAVAVCAERKVPVLLCGAGTSVAGQTVGRAVVIDTSRHMDAIVELDPDAQSDRSWHQAARRVTRSSWSAPPCSHRRRPWRPAPEHGHASTRQGFRRPGRTATHLSSPHPVSEAKGCPLTGTGTGRLSARQMRDAPADPTSEQQLGLSPLMC